MSVADNAVVEADGSRRKPFKAPLDYEPVVPSRTTMVIACVGGEAIGMTIADGCQRPERVAAIADCGVEDVLTPERAAAVLLSDQGSMKDKPATARFAVCLCRVRPEDLETIAALDAAVVAAAPVIAVKSFD